ncbi:hypothetical protein [Streptomyces sp. NPDC059008]|uniref:hypothetical protein n=1 Tax=Streptomyces sp. NPDC059008 TaxID=3346693 RepID=UPI0036A8671F
MITLPGRQPLAGHIPVARTDSHESLTSVAIETEVGELLHQRGWRTAFTVAERVNAWTALVSAIERGCGDDIYEYTNDLYCRDWLHEAWLLLDGHIVQL